MGEFVGDGVFKTRPLKSGYFLDPNAVDALIDPESLKIIVGETTSFGRVTPQHGRSHEDYGYRIFTQMPIHDENGAYYSAFNAKGIDYSEPRAKQSATEPNDIRISGAQDANLFDRCRRASELLRTSGILCEWPIFFAKPERYPLPFSSEEVSTNLYGFKSAIYDQIQVDEPNVTKGIATALGLANTEFGISYRAMLTNYRIADIGNSYVQLREIFSSVIQALQERKPTHLAAWKDISELDPFSIKDQIRYYNEILPSIMGENLARLHNENLCHKYPHIGNWSLAGEIVDLDSVEGKSIYEDDPEVTIDGRLNDLEEVLNVLNFATNIKSNPHEEPAGPTRLANFMRSYHGIRASNTTGMERVYLEALLADFTGELDVAQSEAHRIIDLDDPRYSDVFVKAVRSMIDILPERTDQETHFAIDSSEFNKKIMDTIVPYVKRSVESELPFSKNIDYLVERIAEYECLLIFNYTIRFLSQDPTEATVD